METKQTIHFGYRGNGVSVWTDCTLKREPDYSAHIQPTREVTYYQNNTPKYFVEAVEQMAKSGNIIHSNGEDGGQLVLRPLNKPTKYCDSKFYGRILLCEEYCYGKKYLCDTHGYIVHWKTVHDYDPSSNRKVYFVCDFKYGNRYIRHYAWSMSRDVAESFLAEIQHRCVDVGSDFQVVEMNEQYLIKLGECAGTNLDFTNN